MASGPRGAKMRAGRAAFKRTQGVPSGRLKEEQHLAIYAKPPGWILNTLAGERGVTVVGEGSPSLPV